MPGLSSAPKWWMPSPHNGSNVHVKHPSLLAGHSHTRDKGADPVKITHLDCTQALAGGWEVLIEILLHITSDINTNTCAQSLDNGEMAIRDTNNIRHFITTITESHFRSRGIIVPLIKIKYLSNQTRSAVTLSYRGVINITQPLAHRPSGQASPAR